MNAVTPIKPSPKRITPADMHLGAKLRAARQFRYLSIDALGDKVGVTYQQIQKYETGKNRISAAMLFRFARELGVEPAWFFEGLDDVNAGEPVLAIGADQYKLLEAFDRLPTTVGRVLIVFVRNLADECTRPAAVPGVVLELARAAGGAS